MAFYLCGLISNNSSSNYNFTVVKLHHHCVLYSPVQTESFNLICVLLFFRMHVFDTGSTKAFDGVHQTNGVDVYVTAEHTVLLDSQVL